MEQWAKIGIFVACIIVFTAVVMIFASMKDGVDLPFGFIVSYIFVAVIVSYLLSDFIITPEGFGYTKIEAVGVIDN